MMVHVTHSVHVLSFQTVLVLAYTNTIFISLDAVQFLDFYHGSFSVTIFVSNIRFVPFGNVFPLSVKIPDDIYSNVFLLSSKLHFRPIRYSDTFSCENKFLS